MRVRFLGLWPFLLAALWAAPPAAGGPLRLASGVTAPCVGEFCEDGGWKYGPEEGDYLSPRERPAGEAESREEAETRRRGGESEAGEKDAPPGREDGEP